MTFIPVSAPDLSGSELKYVTDCITSGWISSEGPYVKKFELGFAAYAQRSCGIAISSGTAALQVAVKALGIGLGDEVIMPSFTIISCASAVIECGARPVFVDSLEDTWNLDESQIEAKITSRTKAIMAVHIYGLTNDMTRLADLAKKHNLLLIEDASQAIGQYHDEKPCGSFGDVSIFSCYANKNVTAGEGGMIVTNDEVLAEKCRDFRNLCFGKTNRFRHEQLGWNFRMTNLQAAVGCAQLERLSETIKKKQQVGAWYQELLGHDLDIQKPLMSTASTQNGYWVFGVVLNDSIDISVSMVMKHLAAKGIGTREFFFPLHSQPALQKLGFGDDRLFPVATKLSLRGLYLPSSPTLNRDQIEYITGQLRACLGGNG